MLVSGHWFTAGTGFAENLSYPFPCCPLNSKGATFGLYYLVRDSIVSLAAFGLLGIVWFALKGSEHRKGMI